MVKSAFDMVSDSTSLVKRSSSEISSKADRERRSLDESDELEEPRSIGTPRAMEAKLTTRIQSNGESVSIAASIEEASTFAAEQRTAFGSLTGILNCRLRSRIRRKIVSGEGVTKVESRVFEGARAPRGKHVGHNQEEMEEDAL